MTPKEYRTYLEETPFEQLSTKDKKEKQQLDRLSVSLRKRNFPHKEPIVTGKGRKKLSTMIKADLKTAAETYGKAENLSLADVIEIAVRQYLEEVGNKKITL
ncbi:MAG: hypothetical protein AAGJ18_07435 [Bacteroidota bacterium]